VKIKIIVVGKTKEDYIREGEEKLLRRIGRYVNVQYITIKGEKLTENRAINKETERIIKKIEKGDFVIALDVAGQRLSSHGFARIIEGKMIEGINSITFLIGGPSGLAEEVLKRAHLRLSLSDMTFTHQMVRLFLLEQIYRAFTIIHGEKYHK